MLQAIVCGILGVRGCGICARLTALRSEHFVRNDEDCADEVAIGASPANMVPGR